MRISKSVVAILFAGLISQAGAAERYSAAAIGVHALPLPFSRH